MPIQDGVRLEVYWAADQSDGLGGGPAASLCVFDDEILRLDCFGGNNGHYHFNPQQTWLVRPGPLRLYVPDGTHEDHIEQATFVLARYVPAVQGMNRDPRIRCVRIDTARLAEVSTEMRETMYKLLGVCRTS